METRENMCENTTEYLDPTKRQYYFKFWSVIKCIYWLEDHFRYVQSNGESNLDPNSEIT